MDPLTHSLTAVAMSRAGLNRVTPYATTILLLSANGGDIDIISAPFGAASYLHYHRHITHSLIAVPVVAFVVLGLVRLFAKKPFPWRAALLVSLLGAASHPLMDWWNAYGIRLFLPFSSEWLRLDIVALPDAWVLLVLAIAWIAPAFSRLVSSEIGARSGSGRGLAIVALSFIAIFVTARWVLHGRAIAMLDWRLYDGQSPVRVAAIPGPFNPFRWRGIVETRDAYMLEDVHVLQQYDPTTGRMFYKPTPGPREAAAMAAARATEAFRSFLDFSQFPFWRFMPAEDGEGGLRVEAVDLRFGTPDQPGFVATAIVDATGRVQRSWFSYRGR